MDDTALVIMMAAAIFTVATLYASVGHGGASGYIAVMALCALAPSIIKPSALVLNIVVSSVAFLLYAWAGHFRWRLFWPFAITSMPASFIGGSIHLPSHLFKPLLGVALLCAAARIFIARRAERDEYRQLSYLLAMAAGAGIGLVSGLTGVGGGIFLSPLILMLGWGGQRETSAASALFILANSTAGLLGHGGIYGVPDFVPILAMAALAGGVLGGISGSRIFSPLAIARALTAVVAIAGFKMIAT